MKAVLEFNLPEEQQEFNQASNAVNYLVALEDFSQYIRGRIKYEENPEVIKKELDIIWGKFFEILADNNVELYA